MKEPSGQRLRILGSVTISLAIAIFLEAFPAVAQTVNRQDRLLSSFSTGSNSRLICSFSYSPRFSNPGQVVQFRDTSSGTPTSWLWDFGDGTTSNLQNPGHSFGTSGFRVSFAVSSGSETKSIQRTITVVGPAHSASFFYQPSLPALGQSVQFTDTSMGSPTSWQWDFGDGSTSTAQNPSHSYAKKGFYRVILTTMKGSVNKNARRTITVFSESTILAAFTLQPRLSRRRAKPFSSRTRRRGAPTSWSWNFGDGATSTAQNPSHAYTTAGSKTVSPDGHQRLGLELRRPGR